MKKTVKALALALVFIMTLGIITASAKGNALSNDKFYVELPEGFEICTDYGDNHYYLENVNSYDGLDIIVEGNLRFPDGIKGTPENIIEQRFKDFVYDVEDTGSLEIKDLEKGDINGISACYVYGVIDSSIYALDIFAYILTTQETLFVVYTTVTSGIQEGKQPDYLKDFMRTFLVNGTYYDGEKLSKAHDFSKAEHYIDALERDMLTDDYYEYAEDLNGIIFAVVILALILPVICIVLIILYIRARKKLKEYKEFFGTIEQAKSAMYQQQMQRAYQPYANPQYYGYNPNIQQPNMQPYNMQQPNMQTPDMQTYNQGGAYTPQQPMQAQQPQQPMQAQQPQQPTIPPEMQDFRNNNLNK